MKYENITEPLGFIIATFIAFVTYKSIQILWELPDIFSNDDNSFINFKAIADFFLYPVIIIFLMVVIAFGIWYLLNYILEKIGD